MVIFIDKLFRMAQYGWHKYITVAAMKKRMKSCGTDVTIDLYPQITPDALSIGDHVYLGPNTRIVSTRAQVKIGSYVMFGPGVTIVTGDHRTDMVGRSMISVKDAEKRPDDDTDVVIKDDVWIGANATILKGVTIGAGAIVAAGAVVTKTVPPCAVVAGVPAKVVSMRFSDWDIKAHLKAIEGETQII